MNLLFKRLDKSYLRPMSTDTSAQPAPWYTAQLEAVGAVELFTEPPFRDRTETQSM